MTTAAKHILEQFERLTTPEKREVLDVIVRETVTLPGPAGKPRKMIAELPSFRPLPDNGGLKPHDRWLAEAIMESKGPHRS